MLRGTLGIAFSALLCGGLAAHYSAMRVNVAEAQTLDIKKAKDFRHSSLTPLGKSPVLVRTLPERAILSHGEVSIEGTTPEQRSGAVFSALGKAFAYAAENGLTANSAPIVINRSLEPSTWKFTVMFVIAESSRTPPPVAGIEIGATPAELAVAMDHFGPISSLGAAYGKLSNAETTGLTLGTQTWEQYMTDPSQTAQDTQLTRIFRIVKE